MGAPETADPGRTPASILGVRHDLDDVAAWARGSRAVGPSKYVLVTSWVSVNLRERGFLDRQRKGLSGG